MPSLKIYNTLTRQKELFTPIHPGFVGMYVCGPTVSGESHLGHAKPYITFDVIYRYLMHLGYRVRYVRNITDAGHFEEESRPALDKISVKAATERLEPMELVQKYTNLFHQAMDRFNCLPPTIEPTATGHIIEQINMIEDILKKGYAYVVNGSVYFDVDKYASDHHYGILSGRSLEDLKENTRHLESQQEKRHQVDFALWKNAPPGHIMRWKSPWGEGFPGWHIECSAMSAKYLGSPFDIHGGGMDLIFPHHESEIAQGEIATGHLMARYWIHNNMITVNGRKMGKSYNNTITLSEMFQGTSPVLDRAYSPMVIRFFILQTHYRSTLDFSNEALAAAEKGWNRLSAAYATLQRLSNSRDEGAGASGSPDPELEQKIRGYCQDCADSMADDFNTARVLATLFEIAPLVNGLEGGQIPRSGISQESLHLLRDCFQLYLVDLLGMLPDCGSQDSGKLDGVLELVAEMRNQARARKDYASSDRIRDALQSLGILLQDGKDGKTTWTEL
ncbi:MAG TPA: cysteine--tRNA ligase [Chitinophagaceae bacterium]|nr:cysteine--tRNA ligase [Chitinophagaceae bacterium]